MSALLITGGTGSLGRALVASVLESGAWERVCVYSRDEFKQFQMRQELGGDSRMRFFIGDVRDERRLRMALEGIDDVVHAAALKWVVSGGYNPTEVVRTNVLGTEHVITAAIEAGCRRVLVISSDKAVHPANIYGKSKAMAEEVACSLNSYGFPRGTRISCLRYGNVLWSRGSVAYRFRALPATGGRSYEVTDLRMTRFGIRLSDAVRWVRWALGALRGGEIFVPRLPSFRVVDVAHAVYHSAYPAREKTPIVAIGKRAGGEKLHEMLLAEEEVSRTVWIDGGWVIEPEAPSWERPAWTGEPVPEGWAYTSDKNGQWLSEADLIESFGEMERGLASV